MVAGRAILKSVSMQRPPFTSEDTVLAVLSNPSKGRWFITFRRDCGDLGLQEVQRQWAITTDSKRLSLSWEDSLQPTDRRWELIFFERTVYDKFITAFEYHDLPSCLYPSNAISAEQRLQDEMTISFTVMSLAQIRKFLDRARANIVDDEWVLLE